MDLRSRRGSAGELKERDIVEADFFGFEGLGRLADSFDGHDLLERRARALDGAEKAFDLRRRDQHAGPALRHDVAGVVEVRLKLAERHRWVDGDRNDPGANGPEKTEHEIVVGRQDEGDPVSLA